MNILQISKIIICLSLSIFALLVGFNNLADYSSNYSFVQHVLSMDTVFPESALKSRAILNPSLWSLAYGLIIFTEFVTGILLAVGVLALVRGINNPQAFTHAKNWIYLGCSVGFLLWFFGFIVLGGEWFCMWQSKEWNGIEPAFRFVVLIMLTFVFVAMPELPHHKKEG